MVAAGREPSHVPVEGMVLTTVTSHGDRFTQTPPPLAAAGRGLRSIDKRALETLGHRINHSDSGRANDGSGGASDCDAGS